MTFIKVEIIHVKDSLAAEQLEANANNWSKKRLHVWSKKRHYIFACETDDLMDAWMDAAKAFLTARFTDEQISNKKAAFSVGEITLI